MEGRNSFVCVVGIVLAPHEGRDKPSFPQKTGRRIQNIIKPTRCSCDIMFKLHTHE